MLCGPIITYRLCWVLLFGRGELGYFGNRRPAEEAREGTTEKGSDSDTREDKADPVTRGILDGRIYTAV